MHRGADTLLQVLQRCFNDMVRGELRLNKDGGVDFPSYIAEFYGCYGFAIFVDLLLHPPEEKAGPGGPYANVQPEEVEEDDNVLVFGGRPKDSEVVL